MRTRWLWTLALAGAAVLGAGGAGAYSNAVACGNWTVGGINLMCAGPSSTPNQINGASWPGWAVLSLTPNADVTFDGALFNGVPDGGTGPGALSTTGNLGLWGSNKVTIQNQAIINGNVYFTNGTYGAPEVKFHGSTTDTTPDGIPPPDTDWTHIATPYGFVGDFKAVVQLWRATEDAKAAATAAGNLAANVPVANVVNTDGTPSGAAFASLANDISLNQSITIKAVQSGTNVINFGSDLDLKSFTILLDANGLNNVDFVLNIGHDLKGNGTSSITLAGVAWSDVLINVENKVNITSDLTSPGGDNRYSGILLAGNDVSLTKTQWTGEIIGAKNMDFGSGSQVTNPGGLISSVTFIPEPGTLLLLLAGGLIAGFRAWRFSGNRSAVHPA